MKIAGTTRILVIVLTSWAFYLMLGFLLCPTIHTGPHNMIQLPGIAIDFDHDHGLRVYDIQPLTLGLALAMCYVITWFLFRIALRIGKR
jgi:hypothetical protein